MSRGWQSLPRSHLFSFMGRPNRRYPASPPSHPFATATSTFEARRPLLIEEVNLMHRKAFTLIELLVVIAIIAILAAILFPVFAQAKLAAKKTQSLSNSKQINLGIQMYMNDQDDRYPTGS